ncbi:MAG: zinc-ribbon domain-containing protein, partial [Solirubrobacteraceae bacterium]
VKVGTACPCCAGPGKRGVLLAHARPDLLGEWVAVLNDGPPDQVTAGSHRRAWWRCAANPRHLWRAEVRNRVRAGSGCPYCAGKRATPETSLAAVAVELAGQWHPDRNGDLSPADVLPQSNRMVWWRCADGHEWEARVANRSRGSACPRCAAVRAGP